MTSEKIELDKKEKTILVDVLRWYGEEYETEDEEIEDAIDRLEDSKELDPDLVDINFIQETVIEDFSIELQPYLRDMENSQKAVRFFKVGFEGISEKIQRYTYQDTY
jgi:GTP-dependent phosphoenolpyruvate carboxykinase